MTTIYGILFVKMC